MATQTYTASAESFTAPGIGPCTRPGVASACDGNGGRWSVARDAGSGGSRSFTVTVDDRGNAAVFPAVAAAATPAPQPAVMLS